MPNGSRKRSEKIETLSFVRVVRTIRERFSFYSFFVVVGFTWEWAVNEFKHSFDGWMNCTRRTGNHPSSRQQMKLSYRGWVHGMCVMLLKYLKMCVTSGSSYCLRPCSGVSFASRWMIIEITCFYYAAVWAVHSDVKCVLQRVVGSVWLVTTEWSSSLIKL